MIPPCLIDRLVVRAHLIAVETLVLVDGALVRDWVRDAEQEIRGSIALQVEVLVRFIRGESRHNQDSIIAPAKDQKL